MTMVIIAGFGNPLLDLTVSTEDASLPHKYNIAVNEHAEISAQQMNSLIEDIQKLNPVITPGGCVQNTLRIMQWLLVKPNSTIMYGAVGHDEHATKLKLLVESAGVKTQYMLRNDHPTGISVALINGDTRTLMAHIGAAQYYSIIDYKEDFLQNIDLVYMEAFFLTSRVPAAKHILEMCQQNNIPFAFNLNAIYMAQMFTTDVLYFAENCDILIGNENEYKALLQALYSDGDVESFLIKLCKEHNSNFKYGKVCAVTNGTKDVLCIHSGNIIESESVIRVSKEELVDTNGAGDAFAAGLLCGYLKGETPRQCLKWGCIIAKEIIQQTGCTIPKNKNSILEGFSLL